MPDAAAGLAHEPHHDGSALYVRPGPVRLGDRVAVRVRVPDAPGAPDDDGVHVRSVRDGEPHLAPLRLERRTAHERWFVGEVHVHNPVTPYRFLLADPRAADGLSPGFRWLTARGVLARDVPDAFDFRLTTADPAPAWARDAVAYQVFPDRFARSAHADAAPVPPWARPAGWDEPVDRDRRTQASQLYGGDLWGVAEHLDHLADLGVDTLYLTPVFPARSNHRYDATSFERVDPVLGGDEALAGLAAAAHARGMRVLGDLTTNHTGVGHEWFVRAQGDPDAVERDFYYWTGSPDVDDASGPGYVGWLGHASLPKLRYGSPELAARLVDGPRSVVARWLAPPFELDGWRIDVANMTGRHGADDRAHEVAATVRRTAVATRPDALVVGEHFHDPTADAQGDGWHAVMNYAAFTRPVWSWLTSPGGGPRSLEHPTRIPRRGGRAVVETMREFSALVPWSVTTVQWNMLGSHDTARWATVAGDRGRAHVGTAFLFTYPGTPVVFAGDELGLQGEDGEASRTPMPWDRPGDVDQETLAVYRELAALRHAHPALRDGGLRWVLVADDALAYVRETAGERLLVLLSRAPWGGAVLDAATLLDPLLDPVLELGPAHPDPADAAPPAGLPALYPRGGEPLAVVAAPSGTGVALPGDGPAARVWRLP